MNALLRRFTMLVLAGLLCACSNLNRSLIFATHTTQGLELSVGSPEAGGTPAQIVIGYKRFEGVINPVYDSNGIEGANSSKYRKEAFSVIAKFEGEITGSASASASTPDAAAGEGPSANAAASTSGTGAVVSSQWFATGEAATRLAESTGTVAALSDNPAVAKAVGQTLALRSPRIRSLAPTQVRKIHEFIKEAAKGGDAEATARKAALDKLTTLLPPKYGFDRLSATVSVDAGVTTASVDRFALLGKPVPAADFDAVISYWSTLADTSRDLGKLIGSGLAVGATVPESLNGAAAGTAPTQVAVTEYAREKRALDDLLDPTEARITSDPAVVAAIEYFRDALTGADAKGGI